MISFSFQRKSFNIILIQVRVPTTDAEEVEVNQFHEELKDLLELTPKNRYSIHHCELVFKSRKSRDN